MESRPTPSGCHHFVEVLLGRAPAVRFTDPVRALADLESGLAQPIVEVVEEHSDGSVVVRVSVFSDNPEPSPQEVAAIEGLGAELTYFD